MRQTIYLPESFSGIELRQVVNSLDYGPHLHENYSIGLLTNGAQTVRTGRIAETALAGSVQFMEPFQVHENRRLSRSEYSFRHIEISRLRLLQILDGQSLPSRSNYINDKNLFQNLMRAFDALTTSDNALAQDEHLTAAISKLFPASSPSRFSPTAAPSIVARARDFLDANFMDSFTLDSLAALIKVSRVHISRVFKAHVGLAPHEYLVQLRVARAKALLAEGMPIAEAAASSGFADQSHLTRHFKRITHSTPGAYARSCYKRSRL